MDVHLYDPIVRPLRFFDQTLKLERAETRLSQKCMDSLGYDVRFSTPIDGYGILSRPNPDLEYRRAQGYGSGERVDPGDGFEPTNRKEAIDLAWATLGDETKSIAVATPIGGKIHMGEGGCIGQARKKIFGTTKSFVVAMTLSDDYYAVASTDIAKEVRYQKVEARWRTCMMGRGYSYDSPSKPYIRFVIQAQRSEVPVAASQLELHTAVADAECQVKVGMPDVMRDLMVRSIQEMSKKDRQVFASIAEARRFGLRRLADGL